jgi:hypothetical protein
MPRRCSCVSTKNCHKLPHKQRPMINDADAVMIQFSLIKVVTMTHTHTYIYTQGKNKSKKKPRLGQDVKITLKVSFL